MKFIFLIVLFVGCTPFFGEKEYKWAGKTMGTTYHLTFITKNLDGPGFARIIKSVDQLLIDLNKEMSTYDPESDISKFNNLQDSTPFSVKDGFKEVFILSKKIYHSSNKAFDPTVLPLVNLWGFGHKKTSQGKTVTEEEILKTQQKVGLDKIKSEDNKLIKTHPHVTLDFGAIAKGFGVDVVANYLEKQNIHHYLIEIGGEVRTKGSNQGAVWKIGIDVPKDFSRPGENIQKIIASKNMAIATSGSYRNFYMKNGKRISHTIDPRTGKPISHFLASVTVVAPTCIEADGIATAVMVLGEKKGLEYIEKLPEVEAYFLIKNQDGSIKEVLSKRFHQFFLKSAE